MSNGVVVELNRNSTNWTKVVEDIVRLEKKIFPKHESLARSFDEELRKNNSGLLYTRLADGEVAGYVMYSWPSSLLASITKLAGFEQNPSSFLRDFLGMLSDLFFFFFLFCFMGLV